MSEEQHQPDPGDPAEVYEAYARELWAMFYADCSDRELAADAVQEAFWKYQAKRPEDLQDCRAWLIRVGRNWLRDRARRKKRGAQSAESLDYVPSTSGGPGDALDLTEQNDRVREGLRRLKFEDREVLVLRYAMEWPSGRIAETLDSTATAIDMRLSRARRRLADALSEIEMEMSSGRTSGSSDEAPESQSHDAKRVDVERSKH